MQNVTNRKRYRAGVLCGLCAAVGLLGVASGGVAAENGQDTVRVCEKYCGLWTYYDKTEQSLKYLEVNQQKGGKFGLRLGTKDNYFYKDKIYWYSDNVDVFDKRGNKLTGIYLSPSDGKLQVAFVSPNFDATHGLEFKYKLSLEVKAGDKMNYSVWSSIRGGELNTVEASRVGALP